MDLLSHEIRDRTLYYGDCLEVIREWDTRQVDLIYLDPPFNSKANYNMIFDAGSEQRGQLLAFRDSWQWKLRDEYTGETASERVERLKGMMAYPRLAATIEGLELQLGASGMLSYLSYMAERLVLCHKLLKATGSIYVHCDPTASHYLKVLLDAIFGSKRFTNEIIWTYGLGGSSRRSWSRKHDVLLFYTKSGAYHFAKPSVPATSARMAGQRKGMLDVWTDIPSLNNMAKERTGYPTQKPLALLRRIIKASSNSGDLVLDPFCGCGTTVMAANELGRRWAGIDISPFAVETVMRSRLKTARVRGVHIEGIPADLAGARTLAAENRFRFETWAIYQVPGLAPNEVQGSDGGVDGRGRMALPDHDGKSLVISQVKAGNVTKSHLRDFLYCLNRDKAAAGVFVILEKRQASRPMRRLAHDQGRFRLAGMARDYPRVQIWDMETWFGHDKDSRFLPNLPPMKDPVTGKEIEGKTLFE